MRQLLTVKYQVIKKFILKYIFNKLKLSAANQHSRALHQGENAGIDFSQDEWEKFEMPVSANTGAKEEFIQHLFKEDRSRKLAVRLYRFSAAAIVLLVVGAVYWSNGKEGGAKTTNGDVVAINNGVLENTNTSHGNIQVTLPDMSIVTLFPGSNIKYVARFGSADRDIHLTGEAIFKVAKSSVHPFTVYCKTVVTTALGTTFRVSENSAAGKIAVTLMEGKVAVHSGNIEQNKNYYLNPGNSIYFNIATGNFVFNSREELGSANGQLLEKETLNQPDSADARLLLPHTGVVADTKAEKLYFKNTPLSKVLDDLAIAYNVEITYPTKKVANVNFAGELVKHGSLDRILADISAMNDFKLIIDSAHHKYELR